uniref:Putative translocase of outer mitochondrial membrane complex subunit n=1 Tax=Rhodnius neglectus TaxID=72488 RepID=A0A0P4VML7_9HEMI
MTESGSASNYSLSKWLFAVAVGLPTIGYLYYYYRKTSLKEDADNSRKPNKQKNADVEFIQENGGSNETSKVEGPLERALSLKNSGNDFYKQRMHSEAIRCYTEAIDLCPNEEKEYLATFYQNRAAAHEVLNNLEEVIKDCNEAIKLKSNYTKALTRRYKNHEKLGNLRQALEDVTACCLLEQFGNADTLAAADRILKALGSAEAKKFQINRKPVMPSKLFVKTYFNSFEHDPVLQSLRQLNGVAEGVPNERGIDAAKFALRDERYEDILGHCNEEITDTLNSESPTERYLEALLLRATIYSLTSQTELALKDLDLIINSKPENIKLLVNAHLKRAYAYMHLEDPDKALDDFDMASSLDSTNSDAAHQKAQILLMCEKLPEAIAEFERAVNLNPKFALSLVQKIYAEYRKAVMDRDVSKINSAKSALKRAVAKNPTCSEGYMLLAQVYTDNQEYDEAESVFIQGTKSDPTNATFLVHLGMLYLQWKGDLENAVKYMEKAIEIDPKCEFAYETLGSVEAQRGNMLKSISLFDKALAFSKSEKEAAHILSLKAAAQAQHSVSATLGTCIK